MKFKAIHHAVTVNHRRSRSKQSRIGILQGQGVQAFEHFREHHDITYYADKLLSHPTPGYLAIIIRRICHERPKQAIDRLLTLEIRYLLHNTTLTAQQMALRLGFADSSFLCRFFRKQTGRSLSEYRKDVLL